MKKTLPEQIKDLQEKQATLNSKIRNAVVKEANALLKRMGVCKELTYGELCSVCVKDHTEKKDIYSVSKETLAFRTVKKYEYIVKMYTKLYEIEFQLSEVEKLIKGE